MQQHIIIPFFGILVTVQIIEKLTECAEFIFRVFTMNELHAVPFFLLVRMLMRIINKYFMTSFYQCRCEVSRELFKAAVVVGNSSCSKNADLHNELFVFCSTTSK